MAIHAEREGATLVARADRRIDGTNALAFQEELEGIIEEGDGAVILDFEQLSYISSAGIRVILLIAKALERRGAGFALCSLSEPIGEIFQISGIDRIIPVHASPDEARSALGAR